MGIQNGSLPLVLPRFDIIKARFNNNRTTPIQCACRGLRIYLCMPVFTRRISAGVVRLARTDVKLYGVAGHFKRTDALD